MEIRDAVFISGGTGYVGRRLLPELLRQGHPVRALVRPGSEDKVCGQCVVTTGDVLNSNTFSMSVAPADTFIHLDRLGPLLADGLVAGLYTTQVCTCDGGFCKAIMIGDDSANGGGVGMDYRESRRWYPYRRCADNPLANRTLKKATSFVLAPF
jgi:hypothetical protein